jgi:hypothetical protein
MATASVEGVRLFELATRRERAHLQTKDYPSGALLFSPTGRWLAWVGSLKTIHVWDVARGKSLDPVTGHDDIITGLAFSADECAVVSSSNDSTLLVWDLSAAMKNALPKGGNVEQAWRALAGDDAKAAYDAIRVLAANPDAAVLLFARHLKPAVAIDTKRIEVCLRELDSDRFEDRERATRELEQLGDQAVPALERSLAKHPSLEARRRVEQVLEKVSGRSADPERLRQIRALEALERMGGEGARRLVAELAKGAPGARLTIDAKTTLVRMRR